MSNFPHVKTVQVSFMTQPDFDYVLKPLTSFDINSIPGLSSFIKDQVHAVYVFAYFEAFVRNADLVLYAV
jgi:Ca2+-dependent lipid-binding protein